MNSNLKKSIKKLLLAGGSAAFSASLLAAVGQQNPPPGPGQIPDYFGVVPNFANSPQPILTKVDIADSATGPNGTGLGATATASVTTSGAIGSLALTAGGHNYVSPAVRILDSAPGNGAVLTVTTSAGANTLTDYTIPTGSGGSDCQVGLPVIIDSLAPGSGAVLTVSSVDSNTGAVTGITIVSPGSGYVDGTPFAVDCVGTGSTGAINATGQIIVTPGTPGGVSTVSVTDGGNLYSANAEIKFVDPNRPNDPNLGLVDAVAHITSVNANGVIQGIQVDTAGTGYSASTMATVVDKATGSGATASVTSSGTHLVNGQHGVITAINLGNPGSGYHAPIVEIYDAASTGGSGAVAVATTYDYANDLVTNKIMDVQVLNPGSGYNANTTVTVSGGPGSSPVSLTAIIDNGTIKGFEEIPSATNAVPGFTGLGSGFGKPITGTGIQKFVDSLPQLNRPNTLGQQLPVALPDTTTFPGSDYYEIAATEYMHQFHRDLPPSYIRGYKQLNAPTGSPARDNHYLGPVIVAQKNVPVRIKLVNQLSIGLAGKLPVPVDTTYMGSDDATDTDNRTALHLHGGNTPWISDGTPRQWVKPAGEAGPNKGESARDVPDMFFVNGTVVPACSATLTSNCSKPAGQTQDKLPGGATNNPGDGALTFYYTNEQSARLMFYHDHTEGTTRLNVYAGMAGGYVLQDATEQALVGTGILPAAADTIPLVIQEKTFVPDDTTPVLNFYGPFSSQLNSQDPTWRWGTPATATPFKGNGDLWVPHVFMPNQNPGDVSGANSVGRWDYGPWFWPPFVNIQNGEINNPYYDSTCNTTTSYCEGPKIPGVPNGSSHSLLSGGDPSNTSVYPNGNPVVPVLGGVADATHGGVITESPSGTPEAFNDTPVVNGAAYPYLEVDPKQYRFRILSVGNDRMLNLSLVVAASKNSPTTADANFAGSTTPGAVLCDGSSTVNPTDCTEVKMVPWNTVQDKAKPFPAHWYTRQKAGVTFDGRPEGVFDPATRGPQMIQIGTEGGFLSTPVAIPNQPVNYEFNPKNILIGNIKEHALLLGPAERADVVVDFSNFAGSTLILYNDAGAPVPAWDLRLDYYTGNFDNTDTGGAFSVVPGFGPNSRTLMQIRVSGTGGSHPVDDLGTINMANLTSAVQTAFKTSQEPIIVPQSAYKNTYGMNFVDALGADLSRISDNWLTYSPLSPRNPLGNFTLLPAVKLELEPKTIIEDWTMNWGRMNALLGTEVPHTTAINQTSIPQAFVDPPTDLVKITPNDNMVPISGTAPDGTQLWKITHNGVDSHAVHFHLFHVQLVNRVGWDGAVYPPDANELGWKDTVRMNPLSDTIVALRPMTMSNLPFKVPNSHRLIHPKLDQGATSNEFFNFSPLTGNGITINNQQVNYGWEYLWHCHILGHEENDMMRSIAVAQPPEAPTALSATGNGAVTVAWNDNSIISNWATIQRSTSPTFATVDASFNVVEPECALQAGCARSYTDTTAPAATSVYYRIMANNTVGAGDGRLDAPRNGNGTYSASLLDIPTAPNSMPVSSLTPGFTDYANVTANSDWSATASRLAIPTATVTTTPASNPLALGFGDQLVNTISGSQTVTVTNTGSGNLAIASVALTTGTNFALTNCPASLAPAATCNISVTFKPTATGVLADTLTITDNTGGVAGSTQQVQLSGTGTAPAASVSGAITFGSVNVGSISPPQTVTLTNSGTAPLTISNIAVPAPFARLAGVAGGTCSTAATVALSGGTCTIVVTFNPTVAGLANGSLVITDNSYPAATSPQTVALSGTGVPVGPVVPAVPSVVIDNFNRVNAFTLGANWQQATLLGVAAINVNANQASAPLLASAAYNNTVGGATQGAGFTFANATVNNTALWLKATGTFGNGRLQNAIRVFYNAGNVQVATTANGNALAPTYTNVGAAISTGGALVNGNSLLAAVDNSVKVWVWKMVGATTTLLTPTGVQLPNIALWTTGGGKVGMQLPAGARVDNFVAY